MTLQVVSTILSLLALAIPNAQALDSNGTAPIIDLGYAQYQGSLNAATNVTTFFGIRFGAPPTDDLRWRAPQPPANVTGVQSASTRGPNCLGSGSGQNDTNPFSVFSPASKRSLVARDDPPPSEDCLFLDVFTPGPISSSNSLPVVVWIYGGGYIMKAGSFDGSDFVLESDYEVITVVLNYRIGAFGFLPGSAVKNNGDLNVGLLDQEFALKWVQEHISKFGGDPRKVTIWGESAGAGSVLQHVVSRGGTTGTTLYRGAMTSSTFLPSQYNYDDEIPEFLYSETVALTNCTGVEDTLACLRSADAAAVQAANVKINTEGFFGTFVFVPVVDGVFATQRVIESLRQGKVNTDKILAVTNTNEGRAFVNSKWGDSVTPAQYVSLLFPLLNDTQADAAATLYLDVGPTVLDRLNTIQAESIFVCPTYYLLNVTTGYKGLFAVPPADHGDDVGIYLPSTATPKFNNTEFIKAFSQSFLAFAVSQDPNDKIDSTSILPHWDKWVPQGANAEMVFNKTETSQPDVKQAPTDEAVLTRCRFWATLGNYTGQ